MLWSQFTTQVRRRRRRRPKPQVNNFSVHNASHGSKISVTTQEPFPSGFRNVRSHSKALISYIWYAVVETMTSLFKRFRLRIIITFAISIHRALFMSSTYRADRLRFFSPTRFLSGKTKIQSLQTSYTLASFDLIKLPLRVLVKERWEFNYCAPLSLSVRADIVFVANSWQLTSVTFSSFHIVTINLV